MTVSAREGGAVSASAGSADGGRCAPLVVRGVSKSFGAVAAVADLSFELAAGTVTGFLGPNGAGKTTMLRMIGGLLAPTAGVVFLHGIPAGRPEARRGLGYMPADPTFLPRLTGRENLDLLARLRPDRSVPDRSDAAIALGLAEGVLDRRVGEYSSGMRQKLALVAAFQHRPDLVVLDEPANRLDPIAHQAFCGLVRAAAEAGRTVLLSSHVLAEVEAVCDAVILLRGGRLLRVAPIDELRGQASREVTVTYAAVPGTTPSGLTHPRISGTTVVGLIPARRPDILRALLADPAVVDVTVQAASLEHVFLDLYGAVPGTEHVP